MTAISPVIILSVATRVQARRVEQATQAARSYIDGVQTGTIPQPENAISLDQVGKTTTTTPVNIDFANAPAPPSTALTTCVDDRSTNTASIYPYCTNDATVSLYCADLDGTGCTSSSPKNFVVQAFRSAVPPAAPGVAVDDGSAGYLLGVRVYRAEAFDGSSTLATTITLNGKKAATYAGGKGNRFVPLAEMTTEIRTPGTNFKSLCDRLGGCQNTSPPPSK